MNRHRRQCFFFLKNSLWRTLSFVFNAIFFGIQGGWCKIIFLGYEIRGFENIPDGPFLLIYYHGALPIDMYYFIARMLLFKRRHIHTVADRFMFKIPGKFRSCLDLVTDFCMFFLYTATNINILRNDILYVIHWDTQATLLVSVIVEVCFLPKCFSETAS